jgi:hypothetical protein
MASLPGKKMRQMPQSNKGEIPHRGKKMSVRIWSEITKLIL